MKDFTCFWEASNEKSYDFFYKNDIEKKCSLTQQKLENRRFLHICSLPPSDVYLYDSTNIRVVEGGTNNTVYSRSANVEDLVLLDPPTNVSLHLSEEPGELLIKHSRSSAYKLDFLHPGEVCHVQMRVMPGGYSLKGHWSEWSSPASAMVPQWAADIDLLCHTSDLRNVQCQWNKRRDGEEPSYTLFYKFSHSHSWQECIPTESANQCIFYGEQSSSIRVNLRTGPGPHSCSFFSDSFTMNNCITLQSSKTWTSLDLQAGVQYSVQIQAKPNGSIYNGFWSDWSNSTIVHVPTGTVLLSLPARKVKQLLWPPVPNLQKVLEGFLTDISRQYQSSPITIKQCYEDIPASVVEIVSGTEVLGSGKAHKEGVLALFPNPELEAKLAEEYAMEAYSDYVTLNTQNVFPCLRSNEYVPGDGRSLSAGPEVLQRGFLCSCDTSQNLLLPSTEILNHSYLLLAEPAEDLAFKDSRGLSSRYTNLEHPALHTSAD
ncbi:Thrombopoietin receptor precursor-like [Scleropages formosus]|uniref:Thrombopoietin receptor-like n=1 Tax=Scleropages formosus TaxID=113540 RepID=A0A0P7XAS0_SCLFO|nr:Thrombopoietin receptor precursor-like [Scleropages formosus]